MGCVYFIQHAPGGLVKIGVTGGAAGARLWQIQCMSPVPLQLIGHIECERGQRELERWIHDRWAHLRVYGEWFTPTDELLAFVAQPDLADLRALEAAELLAVSENFVREELGDIAQPSVRGGRRWHRRDIDELAAIVHAEIVRRPVARALNSKALRSQIASIVVAHVRSEMRIDDAGDMTDNDDAVREETRRQRAERRNARSTPKAADELTTADLTRELHYMQSQVDEHGYPGVRAVLALIGELRADLAKHRALLREVAQTIDLHWDRDARVKHADVRIDRKTWNQIRALDERNP